MFKPSALLVSPEAPYPLDGGGALRTASLLHYLASQYDLDLVVFRHPGQRVLEVIPPGLVRDAYSIDLTPHQNDALSRGIRNGVRLVKGRPPLLDRFSGYDAEMRTFLQGKSYDVAVLEHFWSASYLPLIRKHARHTVIDLHNIESAWHASCAAAANFPRSLIHQAFAGASLARERSALPLCDLALVTSENDRDRLQTICPQIPVSVYPNAIPDRDLPDIQPEAALTFSGNLEYEPNRTGLRFFLEEIWPQISAEFPDLIFRVVGKNDHAIQPEIRNYARVETTGPVDDTFAFLARSMICVAPLLSGSGTRLKIIEAWAAGRPVVSTRIGAEGLGAVDGESILLADSPADFAGAIRSLLRNPEARNRLGAAGRAQFDRNFTWNAAWETLKTSILRTKSTVNQ